MSPRSTHRNLRPAIWLAISVLAFVAALALGSAALVLIGSLGIVVALLAVERYPKIRD